jgi:predicted metal-binding membrane protein
MGTHMQSTAITIRPAVVVPVILAAGAWVYLWASQQAPPENSALSLHGSGFTSTGGPLAEMSFPTLAAFAPGWTLMVVAMMLPSAFPFIAAFDAITARQRQWRRWGARMWPLALVLVAYTGTWVLFGIAARLGYWGLDRFIGGFVGAQIVPGVILQATLVIAGVYQFTALKHRWTGRSCSPGSLAEEYPEGTGRGSTALSLGVRYGAQCISCCWALMLLMFAQGTHDLALMAVLGVVMTAEKNTVWAARLSRSLGGVLIGIALTLAWSSLVGLSYVHGHA